jgi:hypothetical protein
MQTKYAVHRIALDSPLFLLKPFSSQNKGISSIIDEPPAKFSNTLLNYDVTLLQDSETTKLLAQRNSTN